MDLKSYFDYLTSDIENIRGKPWLATAIKSHIRRAAVRERADISRNTIDSFVDNAFLVKGEIK